MDRVRLGSRCLLPGTFKSTALTSAYEYAILNYTSPPPLSFVPCPSSYSTASTSPASTKYRPSSPAAFLTSQAFPPHTMHSQLASPWTTLPSPSSPPSTPSAVSWAVSEQTLSWTAGAVKVLSLQVHSLWLSVLDLWELLLRSPLSSSDGAHLRLLRPYPGTSCVSHLQTSHRCCCWCGSLRWTYLHRRDCSQQDQGLCWLVVTILLLRRSAHPHSRRAHSVRHCYWHHDHPSYGPQPGNPHHLASRPPVFRRLVPCAAPARDHDR